MSDIPPKPSVAWNWPRSTPPPAAARRWRPSMGRSGTPRNSARTFRSRDSSRRMSSSRRRSDGQRGSLMFQHDPRLYFSFEPYRP